MKRLTFRNSDGIACVRDDQCHEEQSGHYCGPAIDRLADYEDLGLLAEEIVDIVQQETAQFDVMQTLQIVIALDRLEKYQQAEKEGRMVILPCKVGDTVWYNTYINNGRTCLGVRPHKVLAHKEYIVVEGYPINTELQLDWLGKIWYLSQEEAKNAEGTEVPCKVGDRVFALVGYDKQIKECTVTYMYDNWALLQSIDDPEKEYGTSFVDFGKRTFFNRAEAEEAKKKFDEERGKWMI